MITKKEIEILLTLKKHHDRGALWTVGTYQSGQDKREKDKREKGIFEGLVQHQSIV